MDSFRLWNSMQEPTVNDSICVKHTMNYDDVWFRGKPLTCVPGVVAGRPRQIPGEWIRQIKYSPGQNYNIVEVQQGHNHLCGVSNTCRERADELEMNIGSVKHWMFLPSNSGLIFLQQVIPPSLVYWPREISRKKTGIPQVKRKIRYGMKKAPVTITKKSRIVISYVYRMIIMVMKTPHLYWGFSWSQFQYISKELSCVSLDRRHRSIKQQLWPFTSWMTNTVRSPGQISTPAKHLN